MNYKGIELDQIVLIPSEKGESRIVSPDGIEFTVQDPVDGSTSLPIFTSPNDTVVGLRSARDYAENGIIPVLPLSLPIQDRLEWLETCFVSLTLDEFVDNFIHNKRPGSGIFKVCIEMVHSGNYGDLIEIAGRAKSLYRGQISMMGGPVGTGKTYLQYCKAGFDFVRVGLGLGSLVDSSINPFRTPAATLLLDIKSLRGTATAGLKEPKIILDGGISQITDIPKALALGADYVMIGKEFAGLVEAEAEIYVTESGPGKGKLMPVSQDEMSNLADLPDYEIKEGEYFRYYSGIFSQESLDKLEGRLGFLVPDGKTEIIQLSGGLKSWVSRFCSIMYLSFQNMGVKNIHAFKSNTKYQILGYDGD